jgi:hypothetical protein
MGASDRRVPVVANRTSARPHLLVTPEMRVIPSLLPHGDGATGFGGGPVIP